MDEYLVHLDPRRAALAAGYSASLAASGAYQWVSNHKVKPHIFEAVDMARIARSGRTRVTQDDVIKKLKQIAFMDVRKAFNDRGVLLPMNEMDEDTAASLASIETFEIKDQDGVVTGLTRKIRFHDQLRAVELLGRHLGMFNDKLTIKGDAESPLVMLIQSVQGNAIRPVQRLTPR